VDFAVCRDEQRLEAILMKPEGARMSLALETPDGVEIDADAVKRVSGLEYRESGRVIVLRAMLPCIVPDRRAAHAGTWRAIVRVTGGPEKLAIPYTLVVNARSRLRIEAAVRQRGTGVPAKASVTARLLRDGKLFMARGLHASVSVREPDGSEVRTKLEGARGSFTGTVALRQEGAYRLALRIAGKVDGRPFVREKLLTAATWAQELDPGDGRS
jgi:hypothetical protein